MLWFMQRQALVNFQNIWQVVIVERIEIALAWKEKLLNDI